jgi:hypothetical protein
LPLWRVVVVEDQGKVNNILAKDHPHNEHAAALSSAVDGGRHE